MTAQGPLFRDYQPIPQKPGVADHAAPSTPGALMAGIRKLVVAVLGHASTLLAVGALDGTAEVVVAGVLAVATAAGVWAVPNKPASRA